MSFKLARTAGTVGFLLSLTSAATLAEAVQMETGLTQTPLFEAGQGGYHTYRIPALSLTANGTVLAFCEGRREGQADAGNIDILLRRSADHGRTWEAPRVIVDDGRDTCGNPCPILDRRTGALLLLFCKNKGSENEDKIFSGEASPRSVWLTRSDDDGVTWSPPVEISEQVRKSGWRWYATGPGHGIQLSDGTLVAPCNHSDGPDDDWMHSHVILSEDGGASWKIGGIEEKRTDESTVLELSDGSLYHNMRSYRGKNRRAISHSRDKGQTWAPVTEDETLIEPVCQASVLRLSTATSGGKNRVLFSNPASKKRENLTVRLSYDECKTWPVAKALWPGPSAYSDLVVLGDRSIGCLYERGASNYRENLTFARFTLEWLTDGKDQME